MEDISVKTSYLATTLAFALAVTTSCHSQDDPVLEPTQATRDDAMSTSPHEDQFAEWRNAALSGDGLAAARLHVYFAKSNRQQELYWLQIAAENGHAPSQYGLAFELWSNGTAPEPERIRAKFWLTQAAANGDELAVSTLKNLEEGHGW